MTYTAEEERESSTETIELHFSMPDSRMATNHRRRMHWAEINDLTDTWKAIHTRELEDQMEGRDIPFYEYAHVQIEQIVPTYRSIADNDNLTGKTKTILDSLTRAGFWKDDNPMHVEISLRARTQPECVPWIKVIISPAERPTPLSSTGTDRPKVSKRSSHAYRAQKRLRALGKHSLRPSSLMMPRSKPNFKKSKPITD